MESSKTFKDEIDNPLLKCDSCQFKRSYRTGADEYPAHTTIEYCVKEHWETGNIFENNDEIDMWIDCKDYFKKTKKMKARKLREILNNTGYSISNHEEYIAVGSALCHNLFSVNKKTLKIKYALDTFHDGRKCFEETSRQSEKPELLFIWDKLHELVESGEINDIINGKDIIENPLPVFTFYKGKIVESVTDKYGWPNTDDDGICMYENTHFPTKEQAIEYGIKECNAGISNLLGRRKDIEKDLDWVNERIQKYEDALTYLKTVLNLEI